MEEGSSVGVKFGATKKKSVSQRPRMNLKKKEDLLKPQALNEFMEYPSWQRQDVLPTPELGVA